MHSTDVYDWFSILLIVFPIWYRTKYRLLSAKLIRYWYFVQSPNMFKITGEFLVCIFLFIPTYISFFISHSLIDSNIFIWSVYNGKTLSGKWWCKSMIAEKVQATVFVFFTHTCKTFRRSQISNISWVKVLQSLLLRVHNCRRLHLELYY